MLISSDAVLYLSHKVPESPVVAKEFILMAVASGYNAQRGSALSVRMKIDSNTRDLILLAALVPVGPGPKCAMGIVTMPAYLLVMHVQIGVLHITRRGTNDFPYRRDKSFMDD